MIEEIIGAAAKNLAQTTLGSLLILCLIAFYFTVKTLRQDIKDVQAQLQKERDEHEKTRQEQKQDLRSLGNVVSAVDRMRDTLIENSLGRGHR